MNDFKSNIDQELHMPVHMGAVEPETEVRCYYCNAVLTEIDEVTHKTGKLSHTLCYEQEMESHNEC